MLESKKQPITLLWSRLCNINFSNYSANHIVPLFDKKDNVKVNSNKAQQIPKSAKIKQVKISFPLTAKVSVKKEPPQVVLCETKSETATALVPLVPEVQATIITLESVILEVLLISKNDICSFCPHIPKLKEDQKYALLKNIWKPDAQYSFSPRTFQKKQRKFVANWLVKFSWLAYSKVTDGACCLPCVMSPRIQFRESNTFDNQPFH